MSTKLSTYRYVLDQGSKKHRCPSCNKTRFVRYVDQKTGDYISEKYGRCDREVSCSYFINPYNDGFANSLADEKLENSYQPPEPPPIDYVPYKVFSTSLQGYINNRFVAYLRTLFSDETSKALIKNYYIGSSKYWEGATVFWQIDVQGKIRSGKVMLYNDNGHRVKEPFNHITWVHSLIYEDFNLGQCLFGEHLLPDNKIKPVAIVESEKTAIISSVYFPEFIWLAAGAKCNLKPERCKSLIGRRVVLFPDLGAYKDWEKKAAELSYFCDITVSDLLKTHTNAEAKEAGYDLADYLINYCPEELK